MDSKFEHMPAQSLTTFAACEPGENNEDSDLAMTPFEIEIEGQRYSVHIAGVFDGVSGSQGQTETSSKLASQNLEKCLRIAEFEANSLQDLVDQMKKFLTYSLLSLNEEILDNNLKPTTISLSIRIRSEGDDSDTLIVVNSGDSRTYLIEPKIDGIKVSHLTLDDSAFFRNYLWDLVLYKLGKSSAELTEEEKEEVESMFKFCQKEINAVQNIVSNKEIEIIWKFLGKTEVKILLNSEIDNSNLLTTALGRPDFQPRISEFKIDPNSFVLSFTDGLRLPNELISAIIVESKHSEEPPNVYILKTIIKAINALKNTSIGVTYDDDKTFTLTGPSEYWPLAVAN